MSDKSLDFLDILRQNQSINSQTIDYLISYDIESNQSFDCLDLDSPQMLGLSRQQKMKIKIAFNEYKNSLKLCKNKTLIHRKVKTDMSRKKCEFKNEIKVNDSIILESDQDTIIDEEDVKETGDEEEGPAAYDERTMPYVVPQTRGYTCGYDNCGKKFFKLFYVKEHIHRHLGLKPYKCQYNGCRFRCVARSELNRHIRDVHKNKTIKQKSVEESLSIEETIGKYIIEGYKCGYNDCGRKFEGSREIRSHIKRHLALKPFKCQYPGCDYSCVDRKSLRPHNRKSHEKIKDLKCIECNISVKTKFELKCHKQKVHMSKPFKCKVCDKKFARGCYLKEHRRRHMQRKFVCHFEGCEYVGSLLTDLNRHIMNIHQVLDTSLECKECNLSFKTKFLYYSHKQNSHQKFAKFKCNKCDKRFDNEYSLYGHKRRHTESKPFLCRVEGCGYRANIYENLRKHKRNIHRVVPNLNCKICDKKFKTKFDKTTHKVEHVERQFPCKFCNKVYMANDIMKRHVIKEHGSNQSESKLKDFLLRNRTKKNAIK